MPQDEYLIPNRNRSGLRNKPHVEIFPRLPVSGPDLPFATGGSSVFSRPVRGPGHQREH
ncbi:Hypothetical protein SMAX5B_000202 [Scophthalmus maximus]|uniref:Uncharacterized protein n=1 Tax=Scophthalmus maximus TaxID=52904 RepID=A0A2U9CUP0_SCOMX|nr:Hypothetical protein SMAX5B_000202 [Scophthalmus maximus]